MKFDRRQRRASFEWTPRKLHSAESHVERRRQLEVRRYPLFDGQAAAPVPFDPHVEARLREQCAREAEQPMRDLHARLWREARRDMLLATAEQQGAIRAGWQAWRGPRSATYFRYTVDLHTGVMTCRYEVFGARQVLAREALIRSLEAQHRLGLNTPDGRGNDQTSTRVNPPNSRRCVP